MFVKYITLNSRLCIKCPLAEARLVRVEDLGYVNKHPTTSMGLHTDTGRLDVMYRLSQPPPPAVFRHFSQTVGNF